ncbi:MAG: AAA family ATPase [Sterolibacteriaceae bacterium]|uniref:AAA family ATPase n=1 Tax=Candidatus Methylophosphatis roskildensis TaxID=2899263 RepID=A0A9D7HMR6_9PROT|nr:AAA family ATPase [Candidatus Methylophosphatis roskildensis]
MYAPETALACENQDPESLFQERLVRGLRGAGAYPHAVGRVELIETHISYVLLAGEYAYKIKKAVDLGFLDFRSLQSRLFYCNEELRLNRRTAPDLYLRVVPIGGSVERPLVGGDSRAIEHALVMRRFEQAARLDCMLANERLTAVIIDELAARIVDFHRSIATARPEQGFGTLPTIAEPARQNIVQLMPLLERDDDRAALAEYGDWLEAQHDSLRDLFERRLDAGFVRECHGDLHLANIVLIDGRVVLFDCIEFNEQFRWIDVFNEVAFLAMDLRSRGKPGWSWRLIDRYLEATGDFEGLSLLRYYVAYRAMVRAKVDLIRARQLAHGDRAAIVDPLLLEKGHAHLRLALSCCAAARPAVLITHGLSGSGKSRGSLALLERLGAIRLRSDIERKRLHGIAVLEHGGDEPARGLYAADATRATYARLREFAGDIVRAGYTVIVDAAFLQRSQRESMRSLAAELGVPFAIIDFAAPPDCLRSRVARRHARGSDASDADLAVLEHQLSTEEALQADEADLILSLDTGRSPDATLHDATWQPLDEFLARSSAGSTR